MARAFAWLIFQAMSLGPASFPGRKPRHCPAGVARTMRQPGTPLFQDYWREEAQRKSPHAERCNSPKIALRFAKFRREGRGSCRTDGAASNQANDQQ
jgi:hypothetical protein